MNHSYEFDPEKDRGNLKRHGVGLEEAEALWQTEHLILPARGVGEKRWYILGRLQEKLYMAVFTYRAKSIRLITFHRADKRLEKIYETYHQQKETH